MNKKAVEISLKFLLGLIYTAILIFFAFMLINRLLFPVGSEKHLVDSWAYDIDLIEDERVTQLKMIPETLDFQFIFFSADAKTAQVIGNEGYLGVRKKGRNSRLCAFNGKRITYCSEEIKSVDSFSSTNNPVSFIIVGTKARNELAGQSLISATGEPILLNSIQTSMPYIIKNRGVLTICGSKDVCQE